MNTTRIHNALRAAAVELAPTGVLRAAINYGNPLLAGKDAAGAPRGVSADLARELASRTGLALELVCVESAGRSVEVVAAEAADVGFFAIDPHRAQQISFTAPYLLIRGSYLVRDDSPIESMKQVDNDANRVVVGKGSAYDLFLSRELKRARIERAPTSPQVVDWFMQSGCEVAAGVTQQLEADARRMNGVRLVPGHFMTIHQAMGLPASRSAQAADALKLFVETMKAEGWVHAALERHGISGAEVASAC